MTYHEKYNAFYQTKEWKQLRKQKFEDADGLCEECKKNGIVKIGKEVHHIIPIGKDWSKRLDYDNLILLCKECHNQKHDRISQFKRFNEMWDKLEKENKEEK